VTACVVLVGTTCEEGIRDGACVKGCRVGARGAHKATTSMFSLSRMAGSTEAAVSSRS
jgi:hypothetical protein